MRKNAEKNEAVKVSACPLTCCSATREMCLAGGLGASLAPDLFVSIHLFWWAHKRDTRRCSSLLITISFPFFLVIHFFFARALLDYINSLLFTPLEGLRELGRRRGRLHEGTDLDGVIFKTSSDFYPEGHTFIGTSSRMFGLLGSPRLASSSSSLTQRTKQLRGSDISHTQHSMTSHNLPTLVDFFMRVHERASLPPLRNAPCP